MNTISYIISPFFQLTLCSAIPLISYAFQHKQHRSFAKYLGLKQAEIKNWKLVIGLLAAAIGILLFGLLVMSATNSFAHANSVGARLARSGLTLPVFVPALLLWAFVQTGLSEELLFRGFLAKRLIAWLGFRRGNAAQAVLFAFPHFFTLGSAPVAVRVFHMFMAGAVGAIFCCVDERHAGGSILPSWICHGLANVLAVMAMRAGAG